MPSSVISPDLVAAYREADYLVETVDAPFTLKIGRSSPELRTLLKTHHADGAAFLTACNPGSVRCSGAENDRAQKALLDDLHSQDLLAIGGVGRDMSKNWPGEPSFLVLGLDLERARELAEKYRQNAFVWADGGGIPELMLMR
ncbi:MAG: DUF3293 domain-containing protein [Sulfuricella sp.]|nr:DUF3293 domain-containing protein [Sulfuricella sp.]